MDALHPVFSPDGSLVYYAASRVTGHYSPIAAPRRHEWNVFSRPVHGNTPADSAQQITNEAFFDLRSLDAAADGVRPGKTKLLLSTSAYPGGDILQEVIPGTTEGKKIFQPRVLNAPTVVGPSFGEARFAKNGMTILFLAASQPPAGGN